jgi:energy-converting hydrogenase Eha subunit C
MVPVPATPLHFTVWPIIGPVSILLIILIVTQVTWVGVVWVLDMVALDQSMLLACSKIPVKVLRSILRVVLTADPMWLCILHLADINKNLMLFHLEATQVLLIAQQKLFDLAVIPETLADQIPTVIVFLSNIVKLTIAEMASILFVALAMVTGAVPKAFIIFEFPLIPDAPIVVVQYSFALQLIFYKETLRFLYPI